MRNVDRKTVSGFGDEWKRFDQSAADEAELRRLFRAYFSLFPWDRLPHNAAGFDAGCGSGRWARFVAHRVGKLHCIDASEDALAVARSNLFSEANCYFHLASVADMPLADASMDFGYSLGVLHHVPDTEGAIRACVAKLKPGAPLLLYLYYAFDNRPLWFRAIWKASDLMRRVIARMPHPLRYIASQLIAACIYWPLARAAKALERLGMNVGSVPLSAYRSLSFYTMRTDALDRFGTRLEKRFTKAQIRSMMEAAGLRNVEFADHAPYWLAIGFKP